MKIINKNNILNVFYPPGHAKSFYNITRAPHNVMASFMSGAKTKKTHKKDTKRHKKMQKITKVQKLKKATERQILLQNKEKIKKRKKSNNMKNALVCHLLVIQTCLNVIVLFEVPVLAMI